MSVMSVDESRLPGSPARSVTRRQFAHRSGLAIASLAGASGLLAACGDSDDADSAAGGGGPVVWASFGGTYNEALQKYFVDPFTAKTGTKVRLASNTSLAGLKRQIQSGSIQWDIAELTGPQYEAAVAEGLALEELDLNIIDVKNVPDYAVKPSGIKYAFYFAVMGWDPRQVKQAPQSWADFFDPAAYPQKRSLYDYLGDSMVLEFARLSQGVPMDQVYPLDVEGGIQGHSAASERPNHLAFS